MRFWFRPPTPRERVRELEIRIAAATTHYYETMRREEARIVAILGPLIEERDRILHQIALEEERGDPRS